MMFVHKTKTLSWSYLFVCLFVCLKRDLTQTHISTLMIRWLVNGLIPESQHRNHILMEQDVLFMGLPVPSPLAAPRHVALTPRGFDSGPWTRGARTHLLLLLLLHLLQPPSWKHTNNESQTWVSLNERRSQRAHNRHLLSSPPPLLPSALLGPSSSLPPSLGARMPVLYWHCTSDTGWADMEARLTREARADTSRPS